MGITLFKQILTNRAKITFHRPDGTTTQFRFPIPNWVGFSADNLADLVSESPHWWNQVEDWFPTLSPLSLPDDNHAIWVEYHMTANMREEREDELDPVTTILCGAIQKISDESIVLWIMHAGNFGRDAQIVDRVQIDFDPATGAYKHVHAGMRDAFKTLRDTFYLMFPLMVADNHERLGYIIKTEHGKKNLQNMHSKDKKKRKRAQAQAKFDYYRLVPLSKRANSGTMNEVTNTTDDEGRNPNG